MQLHKFTTLIDLLAYFKDEQVCRNYLEHIRWNGSLECAYPDCKHDKVFKFTNGKVYKCAKCKRQFSVRVGTIFEDSKIPLVKWYAAIYFITAHKKGISSLQLHRDIGVTQKTAWYLLHRIRHSLGWGEPTEKLTGIVEVDETFIGGNEKNKHASKQTANNQGRSLKTKSAIAGVMVKGGELRAKKVTNTSGKELRPFIASNVQFGSELHTDEWWGYVGLRAMYHHKYVRHNDRSFVVNGVHTNGMENFWSLLKRGIIGIYHSVSDKHIQRYVDEFVFRYNTRTVTSCVRFDYMLTSLSQPISYKQLTANDNRGINKQLEAKQGTFGF